MGRLNHYGYVIAKANAILFRNFIDGYAKFFILRFKTNFFINPHLILLKGLGNCFLHITKKSIFAYSP